MGRRAGPGQARQNFPALSGLKSITAFPFSARLPRPPFRDRSDPAPNTGRFHHAGDGMPAGRSHVPVPAGRAGERRHRERAPGPDLSHPVRDKAVLGNRGQDGSPLHFVATDGFSLSGLSSMPRLTLRAATALPLVKLDVNPKKQGLPEPAPAILGGGVGHRRPNQRIARRSRPRPVDFRPPAPNPAAPFGARTLPRPPGTSGMTGAPGRPIWARLPPSRCAMAVRTADMGAGGGPGFSAEAEGRGGRSPAPHSTMPQAIRETPRPAAAKAASSASRGLRFAPQ